VWRCSPVSPDPTLESVTTSTSRCWRFTDRAGIGSVPICVTTISDEEQIRLGEEGFGNVVGSPRPGGTLGVFIDDYLVWARTPPRGNRKGDPTFGQI
jgi:hypothetical protein